MTSFRQACAAVLATLGLAAPALAEPAEVQVTASYRERIALPADAQLEVSLLDISRADAAAMRLGIETVAISGVPASVAVGYDSDDIDPRLTYAIGARILSGDRVLFRLTEVTPVITRDAPTEVAVLLTQMQGPAAPSTATGLTGIAWSAYEIAGRALIARDPPMFTMDHTGQIGLFTGCNRYTGMVETYEAGAFVWPDQIAGTRMACPPGQDRLERDILEALGQSTGYIRNGGLLTFTNEAGLATARFRERPE
ncbi:YbaY family lipoprotein [Pseudooceanicola algae]|uniref:DUF306 domain-containing protein n=1 Tax=Pseudooceanicola algae TaxID=1537215 RepID=A0A418SED4_9RHOB|nr:YbaY family lipoprotein [Pseudooceanicola algae]QPM89714.1 hypothetical protein PSAL_009400 [Pseudooceanicola algae]